MSRYWYILKAAFANFVTVTRPGINLTCMDRNRGICVSGSDFSDRVLFVYACTLGELALPT